MQKKYTNDEITVVWKPELCIHSKLCWTNLNQVFDPKKRPWINMQGAATEKIIQQVRRCPSGALSYYRNNSANTDKHPVAETTEMVKVEVSPKGPYIINTACIIKHPDGREEVKNGQVALCRCGSSNSKPYCDGRHQEINFEG